MRLRHVQNTFEVTPAVILDGICAARPEMNRSDLCRMLRKLNVGLDEIALKLDLDEIYSRAFEQDNLEEARQAAIMEISDQISEWMEEQFDLGVDEEVKMNSVM